MPILRNLYLQENPTDSSPDTINSINPLSSDQEKFPSVLSISSNPYKDLSLEELFPNADLRKSLKQHYNLNNIILKLVAYVQKIHAFQDLRLEPELTALLLNIVKDQIVDKNIDQINLVIQVLQLTFNLLPSELKIIQQQIKYIQTNKLVKGIALSKKFIKSSSRWVQKKLG
jgi:hypothetical protein